MAISGQNLRELQVTYYLKVFNETNLRKFPIKDTFLLFPKIKQQYIRCKYGESVSTELLKNVLNDLNRRFNNGNKVRDTDRSLFFSGLIIA